MEAKVKEGIFMLIAGYDARADEKPAHREYITACLMRARREGVERVLFLGGATNPEYPELTEAEANYRIAFSLAATGIYEGKYTIIAAGDTAVETLQAAKNEFAHEEIHYIPKLVFCAEQARLTGFLLEAQLIGLTDMAWEIVAYGHRFPETREEFEPQRKKLMLKVFSHRSKVFRFLQRVLQKIHQRRMARRGRLDVAP